MTAPGQARSGNASLALLAPHLAMMAGVLAIAFLVINAIWWLVPSLAEVPARGMSAVGAGPIALSADVRLAGLLLSTLHLGLLAAALFSVRKLFLRYARGEILHAATAVCLRRCGVALVAFGIATPIVRTLMTVLVTIGNREGEQMFAIAFSSNEFIISLVGVLLMIIGWAIADAAQIAEDSRQIV